MKTNFAQLSQYPAPIRLCIFLTLLLIVWLPIAAPIYLLLNNDPNLVTILTMGLLFGIFLLALPFWGKKVHQQPHLFQQYGLAGTRQNGLNLLQGLSIGLLFTFGLFALEALLGWVKFQPAQSTLPLIIFQGFLSAFGIGLAEELVFRGWLLDELQRDYNPKTVLWANAIIFAISHFLKPLSEMMRTFPTFPALLLLGLTLVWAKRSTKGLLGLPIGIHCGLVWGYYILNVGKLIASSNQVSPWITGVDGNPLAGIMGILFLSILAVWMRQRIK
ncbi:MAG: type II CAAX endopeptidase family protein [Coleofasciculaceae cyanobacterium]